MMLLIIINIKFLIKVSRLSGTTLKVKQYNAVKQQAAEDNDM